MIDCSHVRKRTISILVSAMLMLTGLVPANAAEVARAPFQFSALSSCNANVCRYTFPVVAARRRMDIQFVSCVVSTSAASPSYVGPAFIGVNNAFSFPQVFLQWQSRTISGQLILTISQPVVFSIAATKRAQIAFEHNGTLNSILSCGISGELVALQ